jgi:hypothetical protein
MKTIDQIEDYKEAAAILDAEYSALNWHGTEIHGGHLATDETGWQHYAFQVAFQPPGKSPVFFDWKNGTGHVRKDGKGKALFPAIPTKPNPAEVLGRVCADYIGAELESFPSWAANFGYDEDSRKAHRIYEDCQAIGPKLRALGLTSAQIRRFGALADMM